MYFGGVWAFATQRKCVQNRLRIPFPFNFFIKKEIILFLCFYGLMVKRFNKDESKQKKSAGTTAPVWELTHIYMQPLTSREKSF